MTVDTRDCMALYAIGVDIGGTKMNAGIVTAAGEVGQTISLPTLAGQAATAERVQEAIAELLEAAQRQQPGLRLQGIGVGTAGQVDWAQGSIRYSSDLIPGYTGTQLKRLLEKRFGLPVWVDNDVNVLALTERRLGAGRGVRNMICLALGTGVGGALVADGHLVHGAWGGAGELGHVCVDFRGEPCICGGIGCLEQYASGTGIARRMQKRLASLGKTGDQPDSREVFARWQAGDETAAAIVGDAIAALGATVASLIHTFNPELVVIGGGLAEAGEALLEPLREQVRRRAMPSFADDVRIEAAYRGNWSSMIGAALQVWEYER